MVKYGDLTDDDEHTEKGKTLIRSIDTWLYFTHFVQSAKSMQIQGESMVSILIGPSFQ